jgi:hypothetical protein
MKRLGPSRAIALLFALFASVSATKARAQEAPVPPPPAYPPAAYPPAPAGDDGQPPNASQVDPAELEQRGQDKKTLGVILMGVGAGLAVIGTGFAVDGALNMECSGHEEHAVCKPSPAKSEFEMGSAAALLGVVMAVVGIPVYIVGARQVAKARRLSGQLAVQPLVGSTGGGAIAQVGFRF